MAQDMPDLIQEQVPAEEDESSEWSDDDCRELTFDELKKFAVDSLQEQLDMLKQSRDRIELEPICGTLALNAFMMCRSLKRNVDSEIYNVTPDGEVHLWSFGMMQHLWVPMDEMRILMGYPPMFGDRIQGPIRRDEVEGETEE